MSNSYYVEIVDRVGRINQPIWSEDRPSVDLISGDGVEHGLKPGDILLFKRNPDNKVVGILARFLKRMDKLWDEWGWHMAYVYDVLIDGSIIVAEAKIGHGVQLVKYADRNLLSEVRVYRWIDLPSLSELKSYTQKRIGCAYDLACYFWTGLQLLVKRLFGYSIPRIINNKYTCWELVCDMVRSMGKPLQPADRYPLITEMVRVLSNDRVDYY